MATASNNISFYKRISGELKGAPAPEGNIPFDIFIENIRAGHWQDLVLPVRAIADDAERAERKKRLPYVTISGTFTERTDAGLVQHSGMIGIDLDDLPDPEQVKETLARDIHTLAVFRSASGRGLCVVFKIVPDKHHEAFRGISEYLFTTYGLICDPTSINPSRARFVSYDPHLFTNYAAQRFTLYPKEKPPKQIDRVVFAADDFERILQQVQEKQLNLCENYHEWLRIGFALVQKFGEGGRRYFHIVSQYSAKYEPTKCDRQYDACLKAKGSREATIATFYYYCKQAGVEVYSQRTRKIAYSTAQGKKAGLSVATIAENLQKFEDITGADDVIKQVYESNIELNEDTMLDQLELWVRQNYSLQRNEITRYIENNGEIVKQKDLNTIYIQAKKIFDKLSYDLIDRLINSDFVPTYNPFTRFFTEHEAVQVDTADIPNIKRLFSAVSTPDNDYLLYFGAKWLVGAISAIYGEHSPLLLVLSGELQGTGKTEFFRRLLPEQLKPYYAESKLDAGKDDEILMTQKLIIMDDEMGGKSKKENKRLKELTSKQTFSLREPYGRNNVDLNRLAVLCGTTNDNEILSDPTGNRRIIPVQVQGIDHDVYNSVDKLALWCEVHALYKAGFNWQLTRDDIAYLRKDEAYFTIANSEAELIQRYFVKGDRQLTATDIKVMLEKVTNQRLSLDRIGKELKRLGYDQRVVKHNGSTRRIYCVQWATDATGALVAGAESGVNQQQPPPDDDEAF